MGYVSERLLQVLYEPANSEPRAWTTMSPCQSRRAGRRYGLLPVHLSRDSSQHATVEVLVRHDVPIGHVPNGISTVVVLMNGCPGAELVRRELPRQSEQLGLVARGYARLPSEVGLQQWADLAILKVALRRCDDLPGAR